MLIQQAYGYLVVLTTPILKAFTYFFQSFTRYNHLFAQGVGVRAFPLDGCPPVAISWHHRYMSFLESQQCTTQREACLILGCAKRRLPDHLPEHRGRECNVFGTLKRWERWEILPWQAWNSEITAARVELSPLLLVHAELD